MAEVKKAKATKAETETAAPKAKAKTTKAKAPAKTAKAAPKAKEGVQMHGEFEIRKKRSGRFEVLAPNGKNVNGDEKTKILLAAKVIKQMTPKTKETASAAE